MVLLSQPALLLLSYTSTCIYLLWQKTWGFQIRKQTVYHSNLIIISPCSAPHGVKWWEPDVPCTYRDLCHRRETRKLWLSEIKQELQAHLALLPSGEKKGGPLFWNIRKSSLGRQGKRLWDVNRCLQRSYDCIFPEVSVLGVTTYNPLTQMPVFSAQKLENIHRVFFLALELFNFLTFVA